MGKQVSVTEAVRKFSEILNSIKYRRDHYTIIRGGKPVASISPVETETIGRTLGDLKELLKKLPSLGDESKRFEKDLKEIRRQQPSMPGKDKWA